MSDSVTAALSLYGASGTPGPHVRDIILSTMEALCASPLALLGVILIVGALLGGVAERVKAPWITGCILAGVILGPSAAQMLQGPQLSAFGVFMQASLAVIAFKIGSTLAWDRLRAIGRSIVFLALAQLLTPLLIVFIAERMSGLETRAAAIVAAASMATAPTTTYAVIHRLSASGPFVDRALGVLALNDGATVLIFSAVSAAAVALAGADGSMSVISSSLFDAAANEGLSFAAGAACGLVYLTLRPFVADGAPGCESRQTATLLGLLAVSIGVAIMCNLSHLLAPLSFGVVIANGVEAKEREHVQNLIGPFEEPLFIVFFVLAGAHLPISAVGQFQILIWSAVYLTGRFVGKYASVWLVGSALGLDRPTRRYLGLCFPSQGALAMGLILAFRHSPACARLNEAAVNAFDATVSIVLVSVLLSETVGPLLIDLAVRRGAKGSVSSAQDGKLGES